MTKKKDSPEGEQRKAQSHEPLSEYMRDKLDRFINDFQVAAVRRPEDKAAQSVLTLLRALRLAVEEDRPWLEGLQRKARDWLLRDHTAIAESLLPGGALTCGGITKTREAQHLAFAIEEALIEKKSCWDVAAESIDIIRHTFFLRSMTSRPLPSFNVVAIPDIKQAAEDFPDAPASLWSRAEEAEALVSDVACHLERRIRAGDDDGRTLAREVMRALGCSQKDADNLYASERKRENKATHSRLQRGRDTPPQG